MHAHATEDECALDGAFPRADERREQRSARERECAKAGAEMHACGTRRRGEEGEADGTQSGARRASSLRAQAARELEGQEEAEGGVEAHDGEEVGVMLAEVEAVGADEGGDGRGGFEHSGAKEFGWSDGDRVMASELESDLYISS